MVSGRKPIAHGSRNGYLAHRRRGEQACLDCTSANRDYEKNRIGVVGRQLTPCPSEAAYRRHRRRGEIACDGCLQAHAEYEREHYHRRTVRAA